MVSTLFSCDTMRRLSTSSTPVAAAENCWNHGDSQARSRLPLRPAWSRLSFSPSAISALKMSLQPKAGPRRPIYSSSTSTDLRHLFKFAKAVRSSPEVGPLHFAAVISCNLHKPLAEMLGCLRVHRGCFASPAAGAAAWLVPAHHVRPDLLRVQLQGSLLQRLVPNVDPPISGYNDTR